MALKNAIPLGSLTFAENSRDTLEINRSGVLGELMLRMRFTITNGVTPPVGPKWHALARLIKRLEITINGQETPIRIDGPGLVERAIQEGGTTPYGMADTVVLTGSVATSYDIVLPLPLYLPKSVTPFATALPVDRFNQTVLAVTFGDIDDIYTTANAAAISAVTAEVQGRYVVGLDPANTVFQARVLSMLEKELTATSDNWGVVIDTGTGLLHRSHLIQTTVADIASDTILANGSLKLVSGQYTFQNWDGPVLQAYNQRMAMLSAPSVGCHYILQEEGGRPMWIPTDRANMRADLTWEFDATLDGGGTNKFIFYTETVRPFGV